MAARYRHDYENFDRVVLCAPFMIAEMHRRAERVKVFAEAHAPYDPNDKDGTHYRDSFEVSSGVDESLDGTLRAFGRVSNTDMPTARFVEFGVPPGVDKNGRAYPGTPRHRTLGAALEAAK
jgi:hypothetical protein